MINVVNGDALTELRKLPEEMVQCVVTSPPYWGLRDYGVECQIGLEETPEQYVAKMVEVFSEVKRVLRDDGTLWLNLGDSYATAAGSVGKCPGGGKQGESWKMRGKMTPPNRMPLPGLKPKDLCGIPWRVAFALQADGWYLRSDIIWHKPNPMPESVTDRPTRSHEYIFLLSKSERYYYDSDAIKEPAIYAGPNGQQKSPHTQGFGRRTKEEESARQDKQRGHNRRHAGFNDRWDKMDREQQRSVMRNKRSVWTIATQPYKEAHFATFPEGLVKPCVLAGSQVGDTVLDPFAGSGTALKVAIELGRNAIGIELNPEYCDLIERRCTTTIGML